MKLEEIRKEVANIVDDGSYSPEDLDSYINEAVKYSAGIVRLPSLKRVGTLTFPADAYTVSLSTLTDEVVGAITYAVLSNGTELNIKNGVEELLMVYPKLDSVGAPLDIAQEHQLIWFQPAMSAEYTAMVIYYTNPALLSRNSDEPTEFPSHLHRKLFVHGAAWMIFDQIEDGIEQEKKVNTQSQFFHSFSEINKESGIVKLREWIGTNRVHHICSTWRY
jgi:hypothetical protein